MPVDRSVNGQVILDEHLHIVPLINVDYRAGLLTVDKIDRTRKSV